MIQTDSSSPTSNSAPGDLVAADPAPRDRLLSATFIGLLATQFLGATNDNILRWLVIGIGKEYFLAQGHPEKFSAVLSAGSSCLVLPYLLLAAPAGYLADRFSKREVIRYCKLAEIAIMVLAVVAMLIGNIYVLFFVVAMIGSQAALFGPSKLGSIPEMLRPDKISAANGVIGLTTVIATVVGLVTGNWLSSLGAADSALSSRLAISALVLIGVAVAGWATSLLILPLAPANPRRSFPRDMFRQTWRDLTTLAENRAMLRVALGVMFFWSLGMLAQLNINEFAFEGGATEQTQVSPMLGALVFGVGFGSVLAGVWSGGKVELGILPLGAGGLVLFSFCLFTIEGQLVNPGPDYTLSYAAASFFLVMLGCSAGLFDVPLQAYMQHRSNPEQRGAVLAASNFLTFGGMLLVSFAYYLLRFPTAEGPLFSSRTIFMLCGLATIPVFVYIVVLIPQASIKFFAWLVTHSAYRIHTYGRENLPEQGGAILVPNHISWLDGLLLLTTSSRQMRILVDQSFLTNGWTRGLARIMGAIPVGPAPKAARSAIETAREALRNGELVCIFPEGGISRSGQLQPFKSGVLEIRKGTGAPLIPVYLDELWGSIFSFRGGRFFWKWPTALPRRVSIWFGKPVNDPQDIHQVRQAVQDLGAEAVAGRPQATTALPRAMIRNCRKSLFRFKLADTSGAELTGGQLLARTIVTRRLLLRHVLAEDEKHVGMLLPPSVGGVVVNAALSMAGRIGANLNYTASSDVLNSCLRRAGIRQVLTTRQVMEKLNLKLDAQLVYLEELREKVQRGDKMLGALGAYVTPVTLLERLLGLHRLRGDDVVTVIFTSGSTGVPKGVMLTHYNIASNVEAIDQVVHPRSSDLIVGIVPFFHSLGYTVTLWGPLLLDIRAAYHFTPLDARAVGRLTRTRAATILLATPTFLRSYWRRCEPDDFKSLEIVVAGAEKLPVSLCDAFDQKFGVRPVEGYGTTELSPLVSVNVPRSRSLSREIDCKEGSVGRPVPGVSARIVDPESFESLPAGTSGMLLVKGPNVMKGYLEQPVETAKVLRDGWYVTGDIAQIDNDGFIYITGRMSRFSKIGGEMVPHVRIEEAINGILGAEEEGEIRLVVSSLPDERKGERIIVVHVPLALSPDEICRRLGSAGLPNIWLPSPDSFVQVDAIPVLGSGKIDLKAVNDLAKQRLQGD
jgi:acyl-[acyl-carrier-protein]-phospholipid O-acyltransferase/long-chain-fatty-acid--[acyl-carrier-protein] ligase